MKNKEIKELLYHDRPLKICILDNNTLEFLTWIKEKIKADKFFSHYDLILIPVWVWVEITDSAVRKLYIKELFELYNKQVIVIDEEEYLELMDFKEAILFEIFLYSCENVGRLVSFFKS